jgi:metal-responsive CopG/Arc/MetJ family transcriptional regulator
VLTGQPAERGSIADVYNVCNMKTIAITIEEDVLDRLDRLGGGNRSKVIRDAVRDYLARVERSAAEAREAVIVRRHRGRLARQAAAAVGAQAKP